MNAFYVQRMDRSSSRWTVAGLCRWAHHMALWHYGGLKAQACSSRHKGGGGDAMVKIARARAALLLRERRR